VTEDTTIAIAIAIIIAIATQLQRQEGIAFLIFKGQG
jgi:hypothetical protein